jgi:hypothetical protein
MSNNFWLAIEVFILILCCLNIMKNIFNTIKVIVMKNGKIELDFRGKILLSMSIAYILTTIILGF